MNNFSYRSLIIMLLGVQPALGCTGNIGAADKSTNQPFAETTARKSLMDALPPGKWKQVEGSVDRGLNWLAQQQAEDGSFPSLPTAQPAVTSFCVLAFLSRGHQPGVGPYGQQLNRRD